MGCWGGEVVWLCIFNVDIYKIKKKEKIYLKGSPESRGFVMCGNVFSIYADVRLYVGE